MPALLSGYELVQRIAVGGMAEVFLARRPGPDGFTKRVAVKRILPHLAGQHDFVRMFLDEARLAAQLNHPHIVQLFDFGRDEDTYFIAMEYVPGVDLQALIRRETELELPMALDDAATLLLHASEALHHAHERGIIHRDVTPSNLLVSYEGVLKLADFGIAKAEACVVQTQGGALKGKIPYMSPEQADGRPVDRRTDVFSLGVCAWELITGRPLFRKKGELETLRAVKACEVPPVSTLRGDVPAGLDAALACALARDPERRWPTARAFGEALAAWMADHGAIPSKARLGDHITHLFGTEAEQNRTTELATGAHLPGTAVIASPSSPIQLVGELVDAPPAELERSIALHLHWPPLRLPRLRLILPLVAIVLSGGGLLAALHAPHPRLWWGRAAVGTAQPLDPRPALPAGAHVPTPQLPPAPPSPSPSPSPRAALHRSELRAVDLRPRAQHHHRSTSRATP